MPAAGFPAHIPGGKRPNRSRRCMHPKAPLAGINSWKKVHQPEQMGVGWRNIPIVRIDPVDRDVSAGKQRAQAYSDSEREIFKGRFQQQGCLDRCVNICAFSGGMGLQGKGEIQSRVERKAGNDFPLPLHQQCRDFAWMDWVPALSFGNPLLRVAQANTRCFSQDSRAAGRALLQNEYSDDVWSC
jgi:hypothetical protein